jgi:hypothetical protein
MSRPTAGPNATCGTLSLLVATAVALGGCGPRGHVEPPGPSPFSMEIREILATERSTPEYVEALSRLQEMGPEVDAVLVSLARDPSANTTARANALALLADRGSPAALPTLGAALLTEEIPRLRIAAVFGLTRLADTSLAAANLVKAAVSDPARSVRLNALQVLDIREVATMRRVIENDSDREVRAVAIQLVAIAESRAAPLARDRRGALRTTGTAEDPAIVFRPVRAEPVWGIATGDLRIELPQDRDIPLTASAEVVGNVVPAFFSPDRSRAVFEGEREIRVVDLSRREIVTTGPGIAPRPIPFTNEFVFLREQEGGRTAFADSTRVRYWVYRSDFTGRTPELVGEMTAILKPEIRGHYSPVRWMVVGETPEDFVLHGQNVSPFPLPAPIWGSGTEASPSGPPDRTSIPRGWW